MNWFSHWDEDLEDLELKDEIVNANDFKIPTKEEINTLFCGDETMKILVPKIIARIKICGGGLTFNIDDTMQFEMPTEEQCENLKKTFGIEVELVEE